ncbi:MAG: hypothetical protein M3320_08280 [Actinomycetota bacterium]|nr:hypothetical protein [Actinomycetota bacterium]MDQ5808656.1 hypothetical protein [Actinomycetota bacterium]
MLEAAQASRVQWQGLDDDHWRSNDWDDLLEGRRRSPKCLNCYEHSLYLPYSAGLLGQGDLPHAQGRIDDAARQPDQAQAIRPDQQHLFQPGDVGVVSWPARHAFSALGEGRFSSLGAAGHEIVSDAHAIARSMVPRTADDLLGTLQVARRETRAEVYEPLRRIHDSVGRAVNRAADRRPGTEFDAAQARLQRHMDATPSDQGWPHDEIASRLREIMNPTVRRIPLGELSPPEA